VELFAIASGIGATLQVAAQAEAQNTGLTINLFWVIVAAVNFIVFLGLIWAIFFRPVSTILADRRERIERGLKDADAARREREAAAEQRQIVLAEARREANEIVSRAQHQAEETRDEGVAETRAEIERLRAQAVSEIDAERQRALADVRAQVADLALLAAGKVVGETLDEPRQRRLVDQFLAEVTSTGHGGSERN
jgi:F-type H+-transporting ATPase subunit b